MSGEQIRSDNRAGNTQRELEKWADPEDSHLTRASAFVGSVVEGWKQGEISAEDGIRKIYQRYLEAEIDGRTSEASLCVLIQAPMWFSCESGVSVERHAEIEAEVFNRS
jgi:hypothetical protein